jgi:hypothetical protein
MLVVAAQQLICLTLAAAREGHCFAVFFFRLTNGEY